MLYAAGAGHCVVGTIAHSKEPAEAAQFQSSVTRRLWTSNGC